MFSGSSQQTQKSATILSMHPRSGLKALFAGQPVEHLRPGQPLFFEGDDARHVFDIAEGTLRLFKIIGNGRRVITAFPQVGDLLGLSLRGAYLYGAEAITTVAVRRLARAALGQAMINSDDIAPQVFGQLCDEMAAAQDQMVLLGRKSAEERLSTFLLKYYRRNMMSGQCAPIIELCMSRQDIADYLGLTIETVSRTVTKLLGKGVLSQAASHMLKVEKPRVLAQLAGDGDEYENSWQEMSTQRARRHPGAT